MTLFRQPSFQLLFHGETRVIASDNNFHSSKVQFLLSTFLFFGLLIAVENLAKVYLFSPVLSSVTFTKDLFQIYFLLLVHISFQFSGPLSTPRMITYFSTLRWYVHLWINPLLNMNFNVLNPLKLVNKPSKNVNYQFYKLHLNFLPTV